MQRIGLVEVESASLDFGLHSVEWPQGEQDMQSSEILVAIDEEISRLQQVRDLLAGNGIRRAQRGPRTASVPATAFPFGTGAAVATPRKRRTISTAGRARIAAAQKARWAKLKKASGEKGKNGK
jgi:hypothetical protein